MPVLHIMRNVANKQGGGDAAKAKSRGAVDDATRVTFEDVAGVDEAKAELVELVEMLKSAEKYARVRSRLPTGCSSWAPRDGQDPSREGGRGRGERAVLQRRRVGVRGAVRGAGRGARPRALRRGGAKTHRR